YLRRLLLVSHLSREYFRRSRRSIRVRGAAITSASRRRISRRATSVCFAIATWDRAGPLTATDKRSALPTPTQLRLKNLPARRNSRTLPPRLSFSWAERTA